MDKRLKKIIEKLSTTLEIYSDANRYFEKECRSTGMTVAQDDRGEMATECLEQVAKELEEISNGS